MIKQVPNDSLQVVLIELIHDIHVADDYTPAIEYALADDTSLVPTSY